MTKNKYCLIFDMDGVVCDSIPFHKQAWKEFMSRHGIKYSEKFFDKHINGQTNDEIFARLFKHNLNNAEKQKLIEQKETIYRRLYKPHIKPLPGLIKFLKEQTKNKVKIALATAGPEKNVNFVLTKTKTKKYFTAIVDDKGVKKGKPDPEIFLKAAKKLKTKPTDCIVFEDAITGVEAGKRAGMKVVGILTNYSKKQLCKADAFAKDFTNINKIINSLI
ncbi:MAG: HAD family phosphatase [Candidatus Magasanikiibacteriota bacterium]